ncbi:hypothetical protein LTR37_010405 [Vermiconidia calcicola]|uniref:Uncharacterized protein n=1 Tax=Vermiconidia calcicola TaxID=1690605 RepID=A0ACC3N577_9PEZI|nr:hypothetical protein LTR37_010405 [Vermiconidia calcicola]
MVTNNVPDQMKAQVLEAYNTPYTLKTLSTPQLRSENDILIKVDAAGYCHTDAVLAAGQMKPNPPNFPHIGSHELAGTVVAHPESPSAAAGSVPIGTRVGVPGRGYHVCGTCFECKSGNEDDVGYSNRCPNGLSNGLSKNGGFAEYAVVDARQVAVLPDSMTAVTAAPLTCAGVTIYNALKRCRLNSGQRVGIIGAGGGLGNLGLQFADAMGLRTTAVDAADGPLQVVKSLGTKASIIDARATSAEDVVQQVGKEDKKTDRADMGLDAVIILPESQKSFEYGVELLRNHGLCVVVSFPENGFQVSARDLVFRDISVVGTLLGSRSTLQEMVAFAAEHNIKAVSRTYSLDKLNDLVDQYNKGEGGKLVVDMALT